MSKAIEQTEDDKCLQLIASDFIAQLKTYMEKKGINQSDLARLANVTEGRVSQVFNHPERLTLETIITFVRVLGLKVAVVGHDSDRDALPIKGEVFRATWEGQGKPRDFWDLREKGIID